MPKTIPQLTDATTVNAGDEIVIQQGGITKRATASELLNSGVTVTSTSSTTGRSLPDRFAETANVKDFGAVGNGVADDTAAIQAAINTGRPVHFPQGTYAISATLRALNNAGLILRAEPGSVTIKSIAGSTLPLMIGNPTGFLHAPTSVHISGLIFDGENIRTQFPYSVNSGGSAKATTAFQFSAAPSASDSYIHIWNCRFHNFPSLPFAVDHFKSAHVSDCAFVRTKDPGFRFCSNVKWIGNHSQFSADNGVSISRGCINVVVADSIFEDCEVNGLWLSGFNVDGSGTLTANGPSYSAGASLTITAASGAFFTLADINTLFTLYDSSNNSCVIKVVSLSSSTAATAIAITSVPAGLQNTASNSWKRAPMPGCSTFSVSNILVVGSYVSGLHCGIAPKKGTISSSTIVRSGFMADSEVATTGSVVAGSPTLTLTSATGFSSGSWVIVKPSTSLQDYFIAKITSLAGAVATLDRNSPATYGLETVRLLHVNDSEGWGAYIVGNGIGQDLYAENIDLKGVHFIDYRGNAVHLGNGTLTSARNIEISDCTFEDPSAAQRSVAEGVEAIIRIAEPSGLPVSNIVLANNRSTFQGAVGKTFVRAYVRGTTRRSIVVESNYTPNATGAQHFQVLDSDNAQADITHLYAFSFFDNYGVLTSTCEKALQWTALTASEVTALDSSGILYPTSNRISITPTAALTINSIDWSLLGSNGLPIVHIENASTSHDITFTHNDSALRCPGNTSVVLPPRDYVSFGKRNASVSYKLM